jgi:uncharacterized Zn finger protein
MSQTLGRGFCNAFARREVAAMADRRSFERGLAYATNGRVGKQTVTASSVAATVRGSASYQVRLWLEGTAPAYDCSCPVGQEGRFCKHTVAVALVSTSSVPDPDERAEAVIDVREYLEGLDHHTLVGLLVERAAVDDTFDCPIADGRSVCHGRPAASRGLPPRDR